MILGTHSVEFHAPVRVDPEICPMRKLVVWRTFFRLAFARICNLELAVNSLVEIRSAYVFHNVFAAFVTSPIMCEIFFIFYCTFRNRTLSGVPAIRDRDRGAV